jgi:hypothetical protein
MNGMTQAGDASLLSLDGLSLGEMRRRVDRMLDLCAAAHRALEALTRGEDAVDEEKADRVFDALSEVTRSLPELLPSLLSPVPEEALRPAPGEELPRVSKTREAELRRLYEALADLAPDDFSAAAARHQLALPQEEVRLRRDRLWKIAMEDEATRALQQLLDRIREWVGSLGATLSADLLALSAALGGRSPIPSRN